mmetsp:Transcript_39886/g.85106  ORF Transcript_39886/g.85106 Transcript_39886/m.85106 type:complete len:257 (-) Transcript_39886:866-1636(-)
MRTSCSRARGPAQHSRFFKLFAKCPVAHIDAHERHLCVLRQDFDTVWRTAPQSLVSALTSNFVPPRPLRVTTPRAPRLPRPPPLPPPRPSRSPSPFPREAEWSTSLPTRRHELPSHLAASPALLSAATPTSRLVAGSAALLPPWAVLTLAPGGPMPGEQIPGSRPGGGATEIEGTDGCREVTRVPSARPAAYAAAYAAATAISISSLILASAASAAAAAAAAAADSDAASTLSAAAKAATISAIGTSAAASTAEAG